MNLRVTLFIILIVLTGVPETKALDKDDFSKNFELTLIDVINAEKAGGDISILVNNLNLVLDMFRSGQVGIEEAELSLTNIRRNAYELERSEIQGALIRNVAIAIAFIILISIAGLIWFYGSRVYWAVWAKIKRGWIVKKV